MTALNFSLKDCEDVIKQRFNNIDNFVTIDFEAIPRHRNNFIIKITIKNNLKEETYCFYAKSASGYPKIDKILYEDFPKTLPDFDPTFTPKYYCGKQELQIFEDLTCQRFQPEFSTFTLDHFRQVLTVLAEFHSAGFAFEEITSEKLDKKYNLDRVNFDLKKIEDVIWTGLENKEMVSQIIQILEESQACSKFRRVLCHGNLTSGNILFHYNNGVPDNCKLLNFGAKLYAPPIYDVLQLIFLNSNEKFRQEHLDSLIFFYFDCLKKGLNKYDLDVNRILSLVNLQLSSHSLLASVKSNWILQAADKENKKKILEEIKEILTCPKISKEDCYVIIKNKIKSCDYDFRNFKLIDDFKLQIQICHELTENTFEFSILSAEKSTTNSFKNEIFIYNTFIPLLHQLEIDTINSCVPTSYFQRPQDVIVFENMFLQNYQPLSNFSSYDLKLLTVITKTLAKLHASSLLFEEKMSQELKRTYRVTDDYSKNFETKIIDTKLIFDEIKSFPELHINFSQENLQNVLGKISDQFRNVVSHGKLTSDDIIAQMDTNCRFINFGSLKYRPPSYDFQSVMYLNQKKIRDQFEDDLRKIYYNELNQIVSSYNFDLKNILSYDEFVESIGHVKPEVIVNIVLEDLINFKQNPGYTSLREKLEENLLELNQICL